MTDRNGREHKGKGEGGGQFTSSDGVGGTHEATEAEKKKLKERGISDLKKMTPAEKIASVRVNAENIERLKK